MSSIEEEFGVETVEDRLTGLLDDDSKYIQQARNNSMETSNASGLQNSSIAAGAGEKAAIESGFDIASQDAASINEFGLNKQAFGYNTDLAEMQHDFDLEKMDIEQSNLLEAMGTEHDYNLETMSVEQTNILSQMAAEQGYTLEQMSQDQINDLAQMATQQGYDLEQIATEHTNTLETMDAEQTNTLEQMATEHGYDLETLNIKVELERELKTLELEVEQTLAQMEVDADLTEQIMETIGKESQQYMAEYAAIATDPDLSAESKAEFLTVLKESYEASVDNTVLLSGLEFDFDLFGEEDGGGDDGSSDSTGTDTDTDTIIGSDTDDGNSIMYNGVMYDLDDPGEYAAYMSVSANSPR